MLRQQVEEHEKVKQEMAMDYKQELKKLHEEVRFSFYSVLSNSVSLT